jgi:hypothetical protein
LRFQKAIEELEDKNQADRRKLVTSHNQRVLARYACSTVVT